MTHAASFRPPAVPSVRYIGPSSLGKPFSNCTALFLPVDGCDIRPHTAALLLGPASDGGRVEAERAGWEYVDSCRDRHVRVSHVNKFDVVMRR